MLNRVLFLEGSVVSSLPCLVKRGNMNIAFLCFCFFLAFVRMREGNHCFRSGRFPPLMGKGSRSFPSRRVHIARKCGFEVDLLCLKKDRVAEVGFGPRVWPFW